MKAGEGDNRGWDGWMASPTQWTWVWINSGTWWWTGRPGVLQFMWSQRVGHDWMTELNWCCIVFLKFHKHFTYSILFFKHLRILHFEIVRNWKWELIFFLIFIFTLFYFTILYWFCYTLTWIHHGCTCVPKHELLEENIGKTLSDINHSRILYDPPPRILEMSTDY